jgi:hypothetical protein
MIQPDVPVVLLNLGLNETPGLANVDITTFAGEATVSNPERIRKGPLL